MFDLNFLSEFSRTQCIAICAVLVPANLLATLQTLIFVGFDRPPLQVRLMTLTASLYALVMVLHVAMWLMIGVVMIPTYVLLWLGCVCFGTNLWAIAHPGSLRGLLKQVRAIALRLSTSFTAPHPFFLTFSNGKR